MSEERSYIAFISYRHKALDAKVARMIERRIESYRVPRELRERTGGSRLGYVFRDEDELPLSSSLSDSILDALDRSRFLIVICTPDLPLSKWCEQEIRYFLQTHDRDHLLAVLADGSGEQSFSPLMLHSFDENGRIVADLEPLAANICGENHSISRKKYRKESLRLLACLIGCPFDTLYQREKRARAFRMMGIMVLVFGILSAFGGYAALKASQIAEHERQIAEQAQTIVREQEKVIESQAELLAEQAEEAYAARDYSRTIELALLSMELSDQNKAQQSRLKSLLISCMNLYTSPDEAALIAVPTGVIGSGSEAEIRMLSLSEDGSRLFTVSGSTFTVWDTSDCSVVSRFQGGTAPLNVSVGNCLIASQNRAVFWSDAGLLCYDCETGVTVWKRAPDNSAYAVKKVLLSSGGDRLYCLSWSHREEAALIEEIDLAGGSLLKKHSYTGNFALAFGHGCAVSPDSRRIAAAGNNGEMMLTLYLFDLETDSAAEEVLGPMDPWGSGLMEAVAFSGDSRVLISRYDGPVNIRRTVNTEYYLDMVGQKNFKLWCYDFLRGEVAWRYDAGAGSGETSPLSAAAAEDAPEKIVADLRGAREPELIPCRVAGVDAVAAAVGNTLLLICTDDGRCMKEYLFDSAILLAEAEENFFQLILDNGHLEYVPRDPDTEDEISARNFPAGILQAFHHGSRFFIRNSPNSILRYELDKYDESYTEARITDRSLQSFIEALPPDDRIFESGELRLEAGSEKDRFTILSGSSSREVLVGEEIGVLSFTPDGQGILVGLEDRVLLYAPDGSLLSQAELPRDVSALYKQELRLYFPEDGTCFYGNLSGGCLIDLNGSSPSVCKYINKAVGFDHVRNGFIVCDYYAFSPQDSDFTAGFFKYHPLDEIQDLAAGIRF